MEDTFILTFKADALWWDQQQCAVTTTHRSPLYKAQGDSMSLATVTLPSCCIWMQSNLKTTQSELGMHQEGMPLICFAEDKRKRSAALNKKT